MTSDDETGLRVVGMGPFPLPGEKKRLRKARDEARQMLRTVKEIEQRSQPPAEADEHDG